MSMQARGLGFARHGQSILDGVDVTLPAGSLTVVLGPNGAGKSTLLQLLAGLQLPASGSVLLGGTDLQAFGLADRARHLAVMTQDQPLDFPFCVHEVVTLGAYPLELSPAGERVHCQAWLRRLELDALSARNYLSLSGGERQRVQLTRVLAQCGEQTLALLLDEPVSAMDLRHQHLCLHQLRALADAGVAVLLILHDLALAAHYADRVLLLKKGRVLAQGAVPEVMTEARLSALFEVQVEVSLQRGAPRFSSSLPDDSLPL